MRKLVFRVSDQVRHKLGCTAIEDGQRLEISDLGSRGIVLCSENKGADQLCSYGAADLCLCFHLHKKQISHDIANFTGSFILLSRIHAC